MNRRGFLTELAILALIGGGGGLAWAQWEDPQGGVSTATNNSLYCRLTGGCAITDTASVAGAFTAGSLSTWDGGISEVGGALTVATIRRPSGQLTVTGSPTAFDGGVTMNSTLAVTGATTAAAIATTGQLTNTLVATSGSSYTDVTMATGASIYQHQASTASFKAYQCWKTDSVSEWICIGVSSGGGASPALAMNGGTNHDEMYVPAAGGYALDVNSVRAITATGTLTTFPAKVSNTSNSGTCTLNGGTPSTCTVTVTAGAVCTCSDVGTTAAIAAAGCAVSLSSTTLTVTGAVAATNNVNIHCDR